MTRNAILIMAGFLLGLTVYLVGSSPPIKMIGFLILGGLMLVLHLVSLDTGQMRVNGRIVRRDEPPIKFWINFGLFSLFILFWFVGSICMGLGWGTPQASGAEPGRAVRLPVTHDTRVSSAKGETDYNFGGSSSLKLKSYQEMSLIDFDPAPLRGHVILDARLYVHGKGAEILHRVTVSGISAPWIEGTSDRSAPQTGSSSFASRRHPDGAWAFPGSDLTAVTLGNGGTRWSTTDVTLPDTNRWQNIAIQPAVIASHVAGISFGLLLFDDTGTELLRHGESVTFRPFPNRYVYSREHRMFAPYLVVHLGPTDTQPPSVPSGLRSAVEDLPAGEAWVEWVVPRDQGLAGTVGFLVTVNGKRVPQYLVPLASVPGQRVRMHMRDLGLPAGQEVRVAVRAVDGAGNASAAAGLTVRVSALQPKDLPGRRVTLPTANATARLPRLGNLEVAIIDPLDKVDPVSGAMIPPQTPGYLRANHLWNATGKTLELHAAKNEIVAFQVLLHGRARQVRAALTLDTQPPLPYAFGRLRCVASEHGPLPDPVVPLDQPLNLPPADEHIPNQVNTSLLCELYVPHDTAAGTRHGALLLQSDSGTLQIAVTLQVWDFTLPDYLSFLPEMNCYGLPPNEGDFYRLAHVHRTVLNRLPYSQRGTIATGCAPTWNGHDLDWTDWDRRFGPYLDGSAFRGLPRAGVPLECFYLPLHENWPLPIDKNYNGDRWADRAFTDDYRRTQIEVTRQIAEHFAGHGWHDTIFQIYLNNKSSFKKNGWSRGSSPWILDEPAHFQDFWALRWFGGLYHEGLAGTPPAVQMMFRCDISRPQWQRDLLDGVLDYAVVGRALRPYQRLVMDRKKAFGQVVLEYGSTNPIERSNMQPAAWCVDAWTLGCDGVLPWQTVGRPESWKHADTLSLFYRGAPAGRKQPVPSIRLKAYRRGQQDVEYLTLLAQVTGQPRWAVQQRVRRQLNLAGTWESTGFTGGEDAGRVQFDQLKPQDLWALRMQVGRAVSAAKPAARRRLVEFHVPVPRRHLVPMSHFVAGAASRSSDTTTRANPASTDKARADATATVVIQGRPNVRDTVLDPTQPDTPLGSVPRDNRVRRSDVNNPLLVRFDLTGIAAGIKARLRRATLSLYIWDPSNKGRVRVGVVPVRQPWDEATATWRQAATRRPWHGATTFSARLHVEKIVDECIVEPDAQRDILDPPAEYQWNVTPMVSRWLRGQPNNGLAVLPITDRRIDDGNHVRFQVLSSEYRDKRFTPKLTLEFSR